MSSPHPVTRTVYYSPRARRHYMTMIGAAKAEAYWRMRNSFPPEESEYENHMCIFEGWHFRNVPRLAAIEKRLAARYLKQLKSASPAPRRGKESITDRVLACLKRQPCDGPFRGSDIAEWTGLTKNQISGAMSWLVHMGLVQSLPCEKGGNVYMLTLKGTQHGKR